MARKKPSFKLQQATQEYLAGLGTSAENLSDEQLEVVTECVRTQRRVKPILISCVLLALGLICITAFYVHLTKYEIAKMTPNQPVFFYKAGERGTIRLLPVEIRNYLKGLSSLSLNTGVAFFLAFFFCMSVIFIPLQKHKNKTMLEVFIKPAREPEKHCPEQ